ncbi:MAG: DUF87 domain-containing protein [Lachnospiraceae bacterium]|nr:DUF87 domain-containing protein [Lachnospiraceae bacterium]
MADLLKQRVQLDVRPRDLLKKLSLNEQQIELDVDVPDNFYQTLLEQLLERDYLNDTDERVFEREPSLTKRRIQWLQITRLPIHPNEHQSYDILTRWQGVLSSLHAWDYRLYFLLLRSAGTTKLFLGTSSDRQEVAADEAIEQLREAAFSSMPGMGLRTLRKMEIVDEVNGPLMGLNEIGAVTGIPSFRGETGKDYLQTLDQLAFGIRDKYGSEKDYAMLVIADPIHDQEISEIISRYRRLSSQIHTAVRQSTQESLSRNESKQETGAIGAGVNMLGTILGAIAGSFLGNSFVGSSVGQNLGGALVSGMGLQKSVNVGGTSGKTLDYLDKFAEYAETATDHHIERLNEGRNLGFWNTGVYVLGTVPRDVVTVTGMLRSVYSGDNTYYEPIRLHLFARDSNALDIVRNHFELLPMRESFPGERRKETAGLDEENWHVFGKTYQYVSTPLTTKELSLATSLPRRDVPGLRFVKTAVRFANNPAVIHGDRIVLGNIVDTGIVQNTTYDIDVNSLVRHALVAGSTGSGKSTTCKRILSEVMSRGIPVMVIEPAKDDYVRWALEMNQSLPEEQKFVIYMPGAPEVNGYPVEELHINPFEPAAAPGAKIDLMQHCEAFATLLNACLPSEDVVPILMEEVVDLTIREFAEKKYGRDYDGGWMEPLERYPKTERMVYTAKKLMEGKNYMEQVRGNLTEVLHTRLKSLSRGMRGRILNVEKSTDYHKLFSHNVIINISHLSGSKDKSLIMSLLMQALYEYRASRYANDAEYRARAGENKLCQLTLVEEAHNVLLKPADHVSSGSPQRAAADLFDSMLSEVREYGQGLIVVDQVPTRLIDGAIKNTNYKIVHRLTAPDDQNVMASCMAFRDDQKYIIPALEKGNAIICGDEDDAATWVKIPAPGKDPV